MGKEADADAEGQFVEIKEGRMQPGSAVLFRVAAAEAQQHAGESFEEEGKIFRTHPRQARMDAAGAQELLRLRPDLADHVGVVDQQRIANRGLELRFDLMSGFQPFHQLFQASQDPLPHQRIERPQGPLQDRLPGDDVARGAGLEPADGQDRTVGRRQAAADDGLQLRYEMGSRHNGIDAELRLRTVPAPADEP